jgi:ribosomal protein S6 kinase beta
MADMAHCYCHTCYSLLTLLQEILQEVNYPQYVSSEAKALIKGLLDGDEHKRLGCTPASQADLKSHPFFAGIDWVKLSVRHMIPPFIPEPKLLEEVAEFASFKDLNQVNTL